MFSKLRNVAAFALLLALAVGLGSTGDVGAASLSTNIQINVRATLSNTLDLVTAQAPLAQLADISMGTGTSAGQADVVWSDTRTLTASQTEDLDIVGGGLTDAFGVAFAPARLKVLFVCADAANTNNVVLGGDANSVPFVSAATTTITIEPGGCEVLVRQKTGITVTAGTGDIIQVANSAGGTSVIYKIILIGTSA